MDREDRGHDHAWQEPIRHPIQEKKEKERIESEWNLPVCDVFRENAEPLIQAVQAQIKD